MDGFRTIAYVDLDSTPQTVTDQLTPDVEDILAASALHADPPLARLNATIEETYAGAMTEEILLRGDG